MVGNVPVGGDAPITVQTMTNTPTSDAAATIDQIRRCEDAGADIIRVSCPDVESTAAMPQIVRAARHADGGQAFVSRLLTLTITALLAIGVIATLAAPLLISLYTTDTADGDVIWGGSLATTSAHPAVLLATAAAAIGGLAVVLCLSGGRSATAP